jgi:hypothetical protein
MIQLSEPGGVGDGQIVSNAADTSETKNRAIPALAILFPNPPPKVFRMNDSEGALCRNFLERTRGDSIAISLQYDRFLVYLVSKKRTVGRRVEVPHKTPWLPCHIHVFRVRIGAALLVEFDFENIQKRCLLSVRI